MAFHHRWLIDNALCREENLQCTNNSGTVRTSCSGYTTVAAATIDTRTHVSELNSSWTPGNFTHVSINAPVVSALKNYHVQGFLEAPTNILNHFWIQVAISLLKPPHGGFRRETAVA
jgi:hypothetical protein